jgi:hypothetical protein
MKMRMIHVFRACIAVLVVASVVAFFVVPPRQEPGIYLTKEEFCEARADTMTSLARRFCGYHD